ncbi:MAG: hypothetical protein ACRERD_31655 [Candidatus Binatia bacterium]
MDVTIIGYGSLMSGLGLSASGVLRVKEACVVALAGCTRGFAKLSRYGDRFAMALEMTQPPLAGRVVSPTSLPNGEVETLALTVPLDDLCRLVKREGYSPDVIRRLAEMAQAQGRGLADFLWALHTEAEHDVVQYRRRLFVLTNFTSAHYIPHPVRLTDAGYALIFLAPGFEGTGSDEVIAVRQQTGVRILMSTREAWQQKPNHDQVAYFLYCLLGGVHGICVRHLLPAVHDDPALVRALTGRLGQTLGGEVARFLAATGLTPESYRRAFGEPEAALVRSGLKEFLDKGSL